ncbi:MAG TPA: TolC family protein [Bryobacteraceae bacterium]|nr:TolC family protein [Bryobacteraceae bacterium]
MKTYARKIVLASVAFNMRIALAQGPMMTPTPPGSQAIQLPLSGRGGQSGGVVVNQAPMPGVTSSVNTINTSIQVQNPYAGSVQSLAAGLPDGKLSLQEAIRRSLASNLGGVGTSNAARQARGQARVTRSALMPNLSASLRENIQQINLAAFGFSIPSGPSVVGPFNYFDLRATLTQNIADITAWKNYGAAKANTEAADLTARDARDLVIFAVSGAYLQVIAAQSRIASVTAQIETATTLFNSLRQQREAGVVAPIDVNRSQVELQTQQQRLVSVHNDLAKQKINLARIIGLSPSASFELLNELPFSPLPDLTFDQAFKEARENRADLKSAETQVRAAELARSAARAERLPSLSVSADYGVIGVNPANSHGTFTVVGSLRVPIWQGGRTEGAIQQAEAALEQRRAELEDLRGRIEADLRAAFLDVAAASSQVELARQNQELARDTLRLTRERFDAGITTTVEVVQAQQSVSAAEADYITSVFAHNVAKISLARSVGNTEQGIARFLPLQ